MIATHFMKYIVTLFYFLLLFSGASAQVSGYMGKRVAVDVNFQSMASPLTALMEEEDGIRFRYKWNGKVEYVLNNSNSIGLHTDFFSKSKHFYSENDPDYTPKRIESDFSLKTNSLGFHYKKYLRGSLAPTGSFLHLYTTYISSNIQSQVSTTTYSYDYNTGQQIPNTDKQEQNGNVSAVVAGIGVGKRIIIANRFTFNFGIDFGIPYFLDGELVFGDTAPGRDTWNDARVYIKRNYGLSTNVGFGVLL